MSYFLCFQVKRGTCIVNWLCYGYVVMYDLVMLLYVASNYHVYVSTNICVDNTSASECCICYLEICKNKP